LNEEKGEKKKKKKKKKRGARLTSFPLPAS